MHHTNEPQPLRALRRARLLTSQDLAALASVSMVTVWRIEAGHTRGPQVRTMRRIADALGVTPSEIAEFQRWY